MTIPLELLLILICFRHAGCLGHEVLQIAAVEQEGEHTIEAGDRKACR